MAQNEIARQVASDVAAKLLTFLEEIHGSYIGVQRPAQDYTIMTLKPGDGSDWEEIIVDTRGDSFKVVRRTIPMN